MFQNMGKYGLMIYLRPCPRYSMFDPNFMKLGQQVHLLGSGFILIKFLKNNTKRVRGTRIGA